MTGWVLGIDGGGTHTRAVIVNQSGELQGWGVSGPSNYDDVGLEKARDSLAQAIASAWHIAGQAASHFDSAFFGMAGVVSPADHQVIRQIAAQLDGIPLEHLGIDHDCRIALAGGLAGRPGIVQITGTGSSCYGRNATGADWRSGGWGHLLADEGSSYWFGMSALQAAVKAFDGRAESTLLVTLVMDRLHLNHMNDVMHRLYGVGLARVEIANLASLVFEAAEARDSTAQGLIRRGIADIVECVEAVARKLNLAQQLEVVLTGGLQNVEAGYAQPMRQAIMAKIPGSRVVPAELPPVLGACLLALAGPLDAPRLEALRRGAATLNRVGN